MSCSGKFLSITEDEVRDGTTTGPVPTRAYYPNICPASNILAQRRHKVADENPIRDERGKHVNDVDALFQF
jgi:hypothetical protein